MQLGMKLLCVLDCSSLPGAAYLDCMHMTAYMNLVHCQGVTLATADSSMSSGCKGTVTIAMGMRTALEPGAR